jgi:hypothetical protein
VRRLVLLLIVAAIALSSCASHSADWTSDEPLGVVADLGLRPDRDGFNFVNFTRGPNGLSLADDDVQTILGPKACKPGDEPPDCELDTQAAAFQSDNIRLASGGACEGISLLSLMIFTGHINSSQFGAEEPYDLTLPNNPQLEKEILRWHSTQLTAEVNKSLDRGSPTHVLDTLTEAWRTGNENYTLGMYNKVDGKLKNGHATIPYKIEQIGNGKVLLYLYNSNLPGEETAVEIDTKNDSWTYAGQYNEYDGSADLELAPLSSRLDIPLEAKPLHDERGAGVAISPHCFSE